MAWKLGEMGGEGQQELPPPLLLEAAVVVHTDAHLTMRPRIEIFIFLLCVVFTYTKVFERSHIACRL